MMADNGARPETFPSGPRTVRELLAETRRRYGARPALRDRAGGEWRRLTHAELADAAADFGAGFLRLGLQPGDKVALIAENGIDWCVAWLGVALAGGVNVPISGELAAGEINGIVRQSDSRFAVVGAAFAAKLDARPLESVVVAERGARRGMGIGRPRRQYEHRRDEQRQRHRAAMRDPREGDAAVHGASLGRAALASRQRGHSFFAAGGRLRGCRERTHTTCSSWRTSKTPVASIRSRSLR